MTQKTTFELRINQLAEECIEEMKAVSIKPSENIVCIKENRRAKKRLGCCKKEKRLTKEIFTIEIASILQDEETKTIKEIILHELLHTCKGCFNHGPKWKSMAALLNEQYGYHISTYADQSRLKADLPKKQPYRYAIICKSCGNIGYRQKKSKVITEIKNYRCSKCGGKLMVKDISNSKAMKE